VEVRWSELASKLRGLERQLAKLESELLALEDGLVINRDGLVADLTGFRSFLDETATQGQEILTSPSTNGIYWIRGGLSLEHLAVCSAPLHVGEALDKALFSVKESVVLTSATLTAEGCFDYVRERLSLEDASELVLGSPFDYRRSTLLYLVQDIPEPGRPAYQRSVEAAIADLVGALGGRTLVLFTSHSQLRITNSAIRSGLEEQGILVLAHAIDGSRRRLLQAFKSAPRAVLLGTSSFWEGIDVVGDALSCVVIVKLPFAVPTDPIIAARSESFDEPFKQYSVPQTILKFKQGFGRLIRSSTDRGVVAILDSRLRTKFYGQAFLQSVPRCTVKAGSAANLVTAATGWLRT
jgi:DNA polymerase-3 subunit epsilon/ATP-dependent DNA helicase DinG